MIRVSLQNAFAKRTLKPLLEKHQATPVGVNLHSDARLSTEPNAGQIYSGMVAAWATEAGGTATVVKIASNLDGTLASNKIFGLFALDANSTINDLDGQPDDLAPFAVWQGGPDAYFRLDADVENDVGPFETTDDYAVGDLLYVSDNGKLGTGTASTVGDIPIATVIEVVSSSRLVIRLDAPPTVA